MIVDSSVLIPLAKIGKLELLKGREVKITRDIYKETVTKGKVGSSEIEKASGDWIKVEEVEDKERVEKIAELEGITEADASIILLAKKESEKLLSNDRALIKIARSKGVKSWWLTTLLLKEVKAGELDKEEVKRLLLALMESGMRISGEVYAKILEKLKEFES